LLLAAMTFNFDQLVRATVGTAGPSTVIPSDIRHSDLAALIDCNLERETAAGLISTPRPKDSRSLTGGA
jgi:hypothetical protein